MTASRHLFFDIGQGQGALNFDIASREALLVDCAGGTAGEIAQNYADCILQLMIVTHLDWDHCADLMEVVRRFEPAAVRLNNDTAWKSLTEFPQLRALFRGLREWNDERRPNRWQLATAETTANQPQVANMSWAILAPEAADINAAHVANNRNKASVVLRLTSNGRTFLFCGDTEASILGRIVADDPGQIAADILVLPHHGGEWRQRRGDPNGSDIWPKVDPMAVIISVGSRNRYGHPYPENVESVLEETDARILCTEVTPRCFGADSLEVHREAARGNHPMTPPPDAACAGLIQVDVSSDGAVAILPDQSTHDATIARWPRPRCTS